MATISEIRTQRETAGQRYARAVQELHAATVDLAGIELALSNRRLAGVDAVKTFPELPYSMPGELRHELYAPASPGANWHAEAEARSADILASVGETA